MWGVIGFLAGIGVIAIFVAIRVRHERRRDQAYCLEKARREIDHVARRAWEAYDQTLR